MATKVIRIDDALYFEDGSVLQSDHEQDCCEDHYLNFSDLSLSDFEGLEFDLSNDNVSNGFDITIFVIGTGATQEGYKVVLLKPPLDTAFSNFVVNKNDLTKTYGSDSLALLHRDPGRKE